MRIFWRDGIIPLPSPWMAPGDAFESQPAAAPNTEPFHGFREIV